MEPAAAASFDANHGAGLTFTGSIESWLETEDVPQADVVVGGPPCQGFSTLNRTRKGLDRNRLWEHYAETIRRATPKWFVMENVPRFLKSEEFQAFVQRTQTGGDLADWSLDAKVLVAADYGAAQLRRRALVIGHRQDVAAPAWPQVTHTKERYNSLRSALDGVGSTVTATNLPQRNMTHHGELLPGLFQSSELHLTRDYQTLSLQRFSHIPEGGNRFNLPDELQAPCWRKHKSGSGDVMGRLRWESPSVTIRTEFFKPEKGRYLHPDQPRALTHLEAARIQGFPDSYLWAGSKVSIARQIGNAVPLALGAAIGGTVVEANDSEHATTLFG